VFHDRAQMQVANGTTGVASKLGVDKRRARVREGDCISRESRDGNNIAHGELSPQHRSHWDIDVPQRKYVLSHWQL